MTTVTLNRDLDALRTIVDSLIESPLPENDKEIFTTYTPTSAATYSETFWAAGYDFTGVGWHWSGYSEGNESLERLGGALVADRILLYANHYITIPAYAGDETNLSVWFTGADGTFYEYGVAGAARVGTTDIRVVLLDGDVHASIKRYPVLPVNTVQRLGIGSTGTAGKYHAAITVNQEEKATIHDIRNATSTAIEYFLSTDETRALYYEEIVNGDSGHPVFLPMSGGVLALLTANTIATQGPWYSNYITEINAAIDSLAGAGVYELDVLDIAWQGSNRVVRRGNPLPMFAAKSF